MLCPAPELKLILNPQRPKNGTNRGRPVAQKVEQSREDELVRSFADPRSAGLRPVANLTRAHSRAHSLRTKSLSGQRGIRP